MGDVLGINLALSCGVSWNCAASPAEAWTKCWGVLDFVSSLQGRRKEDRLAIRAYGLKVPALGALSQPRYWKSYMYLGL